MPWLRRLCSSNTVGCSACVLLCQMPETPLRRPGAVSMNSRPDMNSRPVLTLVPSLVPLITRVKMVLAA